jgi:hypothetical protein
MMSNNQCKKGSHEYRWINDQLMCKNCGAVKKK